MRYTSLLLFLLFVSALLQGQIPAPLFDAIQRNDLKSLKKCLRQDRFAIDSHDENGATPLMWAVYKGDLKMLKYLVDTCGAGHELMPQGVIYTDSDKKTSYGSLACIAAAEDKVDMLRYFIEEKGWDWMKDGRGFDLKKQAFSGWLPLTWACYNGAIKAASYLIRIGTDINADNSRALYWAVGKGNREIAYTLLGLDAEIPVPQSSSDVHLIHLAARFGDLLLLHLLLDKGVDVNLPVGSAAHNPLFFAMRDLMVADAGEGLSAISGQSTGSIDNDIISEIDRLPAYLLLMRGARLPKREDLSAQDKQDPMLLETLDYFHNNFSENNAAYYANKYFEAAASDNSYDSDYKGALYFLGKITGGFRETDNFKNSTFWAYVHDGQHEKASETLKEVEKSLYNLRLDSISLIRKMNGLGSKHLANKDYVNAVRTLDLSLNMLRRYFQLSSDDVVPVDSLGRVLMQEICLPYSQALASQKDIEGAIDQYRLYLMSKDFKNSKADDHQLKLLTLARRDSVLLKAIVRTANVFLREDGEDVWTWSQSGRFHDTENDEPDSDENIVYNAASIFNLDTLNALALTYSWMNKSKSLRLMSWLSKEGADLFSPNFFPKLALEQKLTLQYKLNEKYEYSTHSRANSGELPWQIGFKREEISQAYKHPLLYPFQVKPLLKPEECLIEFITCSQPFSEEKQISALVYRPKMTAPVCVPLCTKNQLKPLLQKSADDLYQVNSGLYDLIWRPIDSLLQGVSRIYLSPAGSLYRLNFPAMVRPDKQLLQERYEMVIMGTTRAIAEGFTQKQEARPKSLVIFNDMNYNEPAVTSLKTCEPLPSRKLRLSDLKNEGGIEPVPDKNKGSFWYSLNSNDGEQIARTALRNKVDVWQYQGNLCSEENFKALGEMYCEGVARPDVLFLSTHGYTLDPPLPNARKSQNPYLNQQDPMYRSGLIMSGANQAWFQGQAYPGHEDGILLAEEIAQMDLRGVKLVVLSACETGLGDIVSNEGVFGLVRAFKLAGVEKVIVSLWKVSARAADDFMPRFFEHWLEDAGQASIRSAFLQTQLEMRKSYKNPRDWAAFILIE